MKRKIKWRCIEPCDSGCVLQNNYDEDNDKWSAETLKGQLCICSKWVKDSESIHSDYILGKVDLEHLKKLKTDFINALISHNIRYSACSHVSSELNYLIRTWEEALSKKEGK